MYLHQVSCTHSLFSLSKLTHFSEHHNLKQWRKLSPFYSHSHKKLLQYSICFAFVHFFFLSLEHTDQHKQLEGSPPPKKLQSICVATWLVGR